MFLLPMLTGRLRRLARFVSKRLSIPHAWIPYHLYQDGSAWRPLFVTLELTYLCNLRCQMCSLVAGNMVTRTGQRQNPELIDPDGGLRREVTTEEYLDLIGQIGQAGVRVVTLTGGEPTMRRDVVALAEAVKAQRMRLTLISNGAGKPDVYRQLVRLGLDSLTISLDGTREVHDRVRGVKGSFDRASAAIQAVLEEKRSRGLKLPFLQVSCAVSSLNQDDIENLVEWFRDGGIDALNFGYLHFSTADRQQATEELLDGPVMHLKKHDLPDAVRGVDTADLAARVARIKAREEGHGVPVTFLPDLRVEEIHRQYTDEHFTAANKCFHPWLATRVDPWGQMYPCWIDLRLGDVREHGFLPLWNSQRYRKFRQTIREKKLLPKCTTCPALADRTWSRIQTLNRGFFRSPTASASTAA
jgi:MoaA/NifB/PqqE/SkfB family radical SAM enzyme